MHLWKAGQESRFGRNLPCAYRDYVGPWNQEFESVRALQAALMEAALA